MWVSSAKWAELGPQNDQTKKVAETAGKNPARSPLRSPLGARWRVWTVSAVLLEMALAYSKL